MLETGTGPTGPPTSGPFQVFHQDTVRLHSSSIDIKAQLGSVLVNFEVIGGNTGPQGATGLFVHEEVGSIDIWGIVDSKCNTTADPSATWEGFTVIPGLIVPEI